MQSTLHADYASGRIVGAVSDSDSFPRYLRRQAEYTRDSVLDRCKYPVFEIAATSGGLHGTGRGKLCTPWHFYAKTDPSRALHGAQRTGDCVSWGVRTASDITRVAEIAKGAREAYRGRQATALIYAARGHTGQGASPALLSRAHVADGILIESELIDADGKAWDFRNYDEYVSVGMRYGRSGLPESVKQITRKHRMRHTSLVSELDALADALWNCYGAHCGSDIGVADWGDPVSPLRGSWAHDMAIVGYDDREIAHEKFGGRVWFWDQSWGNWNRVTGLLPDWLPWGQGMFVLSERDTSRAIRQRETWVFSDCDGFPARPIDHLLI